jgi:hypothetical protein
MSKPGWFFLVAIVASVVAAGLGSCGAPSEASVATDEPTTVTVHVPFPTASLFDAPATATLEAERGTSVVAVALPPVPDYDALADAEFANYACAQWAGEVIAAGWPHELVPKVLRTIWRESNCRWDVRSTTSDSGLLQINDIVLRDWRFQRDFPNFDRATIFDPHVNLTVALWLWTIDGWTPWRGGA